MKATVALFAAALVAVGLGVFACADTAAGAGVSPAAAPAGVVPVTFTVRYTWDGTPETVVSGTLPGCATGTVETSANPDQQFGNVWMFTGSKTFSCASGGIFTLAYSALRIGDSSTAFGNWWITGGTGMYSGMTGGGIIRGVYMYDQSTPPNRVGITDTYWGLVRLT